MGESSKEWHSFGKQKSYEDMVEYFRNREYEHSNYYHYTNLKVIDSILEKEEFWVSCVNGFNDKKDKEQFGDNITGKEYYSLCFSTGVNENLPLWYLYSGINGEGGRIRLTPGAVKQLIDNGEFTLYELKEENKKSLGKRIMSLKKCQTMELDFKDVIYIKEADDRVSMKYNNMTNYNFKINDDEFNEIKNKWNHFIKGLIWFYEKETRLIVHLIGDAKKIVTQNKKVPYVVTISFKNNNDVLRNLGVGFAPRIEENRLENIFSEHTAIGNHKNLNYNVKLSEYSGSVEIDFCSKCPKNNK